MSRKGNDLARAYLWNAARAAITHNPAVRALYRRLRAKGTRGDVAIGHCMRKLLHLAFAVWKTDRPFDAGHYPWEPAGEQATTTSPPEPAADSGNEEAVGHKRDEPAGKVVTTAPLTVEPIPPAVNPPALSVPEVRPRVDYAFLRQQTSMGRCSRSWTCWRSWAAAVSNVAVPCPLHGHAAAAERTFSVNLSKNTFQCFHAECAARGNALDLWAAVHHLPLYEAALHLAETFELPRNREEEPVRRTRPPQ